MMFQTSKSTAPATESEKSEKVDTSRKQPPQQSIISSDLTIKGDLVCTGDLQIDGRVDGDITCRTLTLGAEPVINSKVKAETVRICGSFTGEIRAKKVVLTSTAKVKGDIYQDVLELERGASFEGFVGRLDTDKAGQETKVTALKSA
jgi:cytoskeletal protein CcmA (bactofilin family)